MSQARLIEELIKLSYSKKWEDAKDEWILSTIYEAEVPEICLCGHTPIIEVCVLSNTTNKSIVHVGNCCVKKFLGIRSDRLFDSIKKIKKEPRKSVNEDMLSYAYQRGWLGQWEYKFYSDIILKRVLSYKQEGIKYKINNKILVGWFKKEKIKENIKIYPTVFEDSGITDLIKQQGDI